MIRAIHNRRTLARDRCTVNDYADARPHLAETARDTLRQVMVYYLSLKSLSTYLTAYFPHTNHTLSQRELRFDTFLSPN